MPLRFPSALRHGFTQRDADVLDGVVLVDVEIAAGVHVQIEAAMPRDQIEHVIEKTDARVIREPALAVDVQGHAGCASPRSADRSPRAA